MFHKYVQPHTYSKSRFMTSNTGARNRAPGTRAANIKQPLNVHRWHLKGLPFFRRLTLHLLYIRRITPVESGTPPLMNFKLAICVPFQVPVFNYITLIVNLLSFTDTDLYFHESFYKIKPYRD